jgi:hypothetical protein
MIVEYMTLTTAPVRTVFNQQQREPEGMEFKMMKYEPCTRRCTPPPFGQQRRLHISLTYFATTDGIVNGNLLQKFAAVVQSPKVHCFYNLQITTDETSSLLIVTVLLIVMSKEAARLFKRALTHSPVFLARPLVQQHYTTSCTQLQ